MAELPNRRGYHHGDARNALVTAAGALLEEVGAAGLSLRQVAESAGLSRQAPYNHFADKEALLAAIVRSGFERLALDLRTATTGHTDREALAAAASAYIGFAQGAPAMFRLMFSRELVDQTKFPDVAAAGSEAFGVLAGIVASFAATERVEDLSLSAWCLVHGYASLCNEAAIEDSGQRERRARLFASAMCAAAAAAGDRPDDRRD